MISSNLERAVEKGLNLVQNINEVWVSSDYEMKQPLQNLIFLKVILYTKRTTVRSNKTSLLFTSFSYLARVLTKNKKDNLLQDCLFESDVGMTRFELATPRPPDVYSTGLSYIPTELKLPTGSFIFMVDFEMINLQQASRLCDYAMSQQLMFTNIELIDHFCILKQT